MAKFSGFDDSIIVSKKDLTVMVGALLDFLDSKSYPEITKLAFKYKDRLDNTPTFLSKEEVQKMADQIAQGFSGYMHDQT